MEGQEDVRLVLDSFFCDAKLERARGYNVRESQRGLMSKLIGMSESLRGMQYEERCKVLKVVTAIQQQMRKPEISDNFIFQPTLMFLYTKLKLLTTVDKPFDIQYPDILTQIFIFVTSKSPDDNFTVDQRQLPGCYSEILQNFVRDIKAAKSLSFINHSTLVSPILPVSVFNLVKMYGNFRSRISLSLSDLVAYEPSLIFQQPSPPAVSWVVEFTGKYWAGYMELQSAFISVQRLIKVCATNVQESKRGGSHRTCINIYKILCLAMALQGRLVDKIVKIQKEFEMNEMQLRNINEMYEEHVRKLKQVTSECNTEKLEKQMAQVMAW